MSVPSIHPPGGPTSLGPPGPTRTQASDAPRGDDRHAPGVVLHGVVECTVSFIERIRSIVHAHLDTEPTISIHVLTLNHEITRAVLRWIEQWPSTGEGTEL